MHHPERNHQIVVIALKKPKGNLYNVPAIYQTREANGKIKTHTYKGAKTNMFKAIKQWWNNRKKSRL